MQYPCSSWMKLIHRRCPIIRPAFVFVGMPPWWYAMYIPATTNHLYNNCTMLKTLDWRCGNVIQMFCVCWECVALKQFSFSFFIAQTSFINQFFTWSMSNICWSIYFIYLKSDWMYCLSLLHIIAYTFNYPACLLTSILLCKAKRQYLLTLQVSR